MPRRIESLFIAGPAGRLEAVLEEPEDQAPREAVLICHPHPQFGGTLHNKVVYRMARGLRRAGAVALRFNYRGVNMSEGIYDNGVGELEDARVALEFLRSRYPELLFSLAGFSFGSRIILKLGCEIPQVRRLIAVGFPAGDPAYRVSFPRLRSGIRIRVVERGDPSWPPVVLVHGWGCSVYVFRYNLPALAEAGFRSIAVDLKGHGLSDKPLASDEYTIDSLVEHLRDILDALGLERPALAGHSLGGSLIYHFASRYPERARCLGMLSPVGFKGVPLMWLYRFLTPAALMPILRQINPRVVVKRALKRVYGKRGHFTKRDVEEYLAPSQFPEYALAMRELLHSYDWNAADHRQLGGTSVCRCEAELRSGADARDQPSGLPDPAQKGRLPSPHVGNEAYGVCAKPHTAQ